MYEDTRRPERPLGVSRAEGRHCVRSGRQSGPDSKLTRYAGRRVGSSRELCRLRSSDRPEPVYYCRPILRPLPRSLLQPVQMNVLHVGGLPELTKPLRVFGELCTNVDVLAGLVVVIADGLECSILLQRSLALHFAHVLVPAVSARLPGGNVDPVGVT